MRPSDVRKRHTAAVLTAKLLIFFSGPAFTKAWSTVLGAPLRTRWPTRPRRASADARFHTPLDHFYERGRPPFDDLVLNTEECVFAVMSKPRALKLVPIIDCPLARVRVRPRNGPGEAHSHPR
jgi:hypothetical protein